MAGGDLSGTACATTCTATEEEDFSNDATLNNVCADGTCNGLPVTACTDTICDGIINDGACDDGTCDGNFADSTCDDGVCDGTEVVQTGGGGNCVVFSSQPDSVSGPNPPPQNPEFTVIENDSGSNPALCTVTVWVNTVLHNASDPGTNDTFECDGTDVSGTEECIFRPRSCRKPQNAGGDVLDKNSDPVVDTEELNTAKVFDDVGDLVQLATDTAGNALFTVSNQLAALDTDGDGTADCVDPFPNDNTQE